jgi:hypothetical protein
MGRGRAKAKQTKVARDLKYQSPDMDLDRLRQEIGAADGSDKVDEYDEFASDPYAVDDDGSAPRRR